MILRDTCCLETLAFLSLDICHIVADNTILAWIELLLFFLNLALSNSASLLQQSYSLSCDTHLKLA